MEERIRWARDEAFRMPNIAVDDYHRFPPSKYYKFLGCMTKELRAEWAIELGVCGGGGSYHIAFMNPTTHVLGVDVQREYPDNIKYIEDTCPNWTFVENDSLLFSKNLEKFTPASIDLLFVDTTHEYNQTKWEFEAFLPLMSPGGVICMDDLNRVGVRRYWNEITLPKIEIPELHLGGSPTDGSFGVVWGWK